MTTWVRATCGVGGVALALGCTLASLIWTYDGRYRATGPIDAAVVLGAAAPGGSPSPVFTGRLEYAETLLQQNAVRFVIVTGGGRDDPTQPEARAGARFLLERGADPARVLFETSSKTTPENLCYAAKLGAAHGLRSYAIVSDPLHLRRALRYARDIGMDARPAASPTTRYRGLGAKLQFTLRETYLYAKRLLGGPVRCPP